jgi:hypothetical protein
MMEYPQTKEEADAIKSSYRKLRLINKMHTAYGIYSGNQCGDCAHLLRINYHCKIYYKCELYRVSQCSASDWRKSWIACGKFVLQEESR